MHPSKTYNSQQKKKGIQILKDVEGVKTTSEQPSPSTTAKSNPSSHQQNEESSAVGNSASAARDPSPFRDPSSTSLVSKNATPTEKPSTPGFSSSAARNNNNNNSNVVTLPVIPNSARKPQLHQHQPLIASPPTSKPPTPSSATNTTTSLMTTVTATASSPHARRNMQYVVANNNDDDGSLTDKISFAASSSTPPSNNNNNNNTNNPHVARFPLPPALPPIPPPPTTVNMMPLTMNQVKLRTMLQESCVALVENVLKSNSSNGGNNFPLHQNSNTSIQISLLEETGDNNKNSVWQFKVPVSLSSLSSTSNQKNDDNLIIQQQQQQQQQLFLASLILASQQQQQQQQNASINNNNANSELSFQQSITVNNQDNNSNNTTNVIMLPPSSPPPVPARGIISFANIDDLDDGDQNIIPPHNLRKRDSHNNNNNNLGFGSSSTITAAAAESTTTSINTVTSSSQQSNANDDNRNNLSPEQTLQPQPSLSSCGSSATSMSPQQFLTMVNTLMAQQQQQQNNNNNTNTNQIPSSSNNNDKNNTHESSNNGVDPSMFLRSINQLMHAMPSASVIFGRSTDFGNGSTSTLSPSSPTNQANNHTNNPSLNNSTQNNKLVNFGTVFAESNNNNNNNSALTAASSPLSSLVGGGGVGNGDGVLVGSVGGGGDLKNFKNRVKAAFQAQAKVFQKEIRARDEVISTSRTALCKYEAGGEFFNEWKLKIEERDKMISKQDDKIKSLVKLLERTGVAMKKLEKRLAYEMNVNSNNNNNGGNNNNNNNRITKGNSNITAAALAVANNTTSSSQNAITSSPSSPQSARIDSFVNNGGSGGIGGVNRQGSQLRSFSGGVPQRRGTNNGGGGNSSIRRRTFAGGDVDWALLYDQVRDLNADNHDNATVVRDIVELIANLKDQASDLEIQYDTAVDRFNERDKIVSTLRKDNKALSDKLDEADRLMEAMLADIRKLQDDAERTEHALSQQKKSLEGDKEALLKRIIELEGNIAKSVESKPFFVGLGRSLAVLPFLRFEGRVKNLDLPKADVEGIIQRIWAKRDPDRTSLRRAQISIAFYLNNLYPGHAVYDAPASTVTVSADDEITDLVDYDNVKFVRRTGTSFIDFVTILLLEKSASLVYGGEAFDFDPATSNFNNNMTIIGSPSASTALKDFNNINNSNQQNGSTTTTSKNTKANKSFRGNNNSNALDSDFAGASGLNLLSSPSMSTAYENKNTKDTNNNQTSSTTTTTTTGTTGGTKGKPSARARTKSQVFKKGEQLRGASRDWKNNPAFCVPTQVAEIAYSLMEGCERFKYDADIELFRAIVREEVPELAWFDQMVMLAKLKAALLQAGRIRSGRSGTATVQVIMQTLYEFFPCKDKESFIFLKNALFLEAKRALEQEKANQNNNNNNNNLGGGRKGSLQTNNSKKTTSFGAASSFNVAQQQQLVYNMINNNNHNNHDDIHNTAEEEEEMFMGTQLGIHELFESNQFGNQGPFAEAVRDQHLEEACMYAAELATAASMAADPTSGRAQIADIRFALQDIDPQKAIEEVDDFIAKVVAILLDEDGVDPFEAKVAPTTTLSNNNFANSSQQPLPSDVTNPGVGHAIVFSTSNANISRSATPALNSNNAAVASPTFLGVSNLTANLSGSFNNNGSLVRQASSNVLGGGNRAHELMIMVEEGRQLKQVADTDLVDCERFASACRGVFSKRYGPRKQALHSTNSGHGFGLSFFGNNNNNNNSNLNYFTNNNNNTHENKKEDSPSKPNSKQESFTLGGAGGGGLVQLGSNVSSTGSNGNANATTALTAASQQSGAYEKSGIFDKHDFMKSNWKTSIQEQRKGSTAVFPDAEHENGNDDDGDDSGALDRSGEIVKDSPPLKPSAVEVANENELHAEPTRIGIFDREIVMAKDEENPGEEREVEDFQDTSGVGDNNENQNEGVEGEQS